MCTKQTMLDPGSNVEIAACAGRVACFLRGCWRDVARVAFASPTHIFFTCVLDVPTCHAPRARRASRLSSPRSRPSAGALPPSSAAVGDDCVCAFSSSRSSTSTVCPTRMYRSRCRRKQKTTRNSDAWHTFPSTKWLSSHRSSYPRWAPQVERRQGESHFLCCSR